MYLQVFQYLFIWAFKEWPSRHQQMYDLGLLTSTKVSFERVQTCTIHTSFSIFNCGWCCNGHKWWALHDQRHLKCVGTRPEGPCPLHNFVPTIDHIHVEICTKKLFQAAMIFFLPAAGPYQVWYQDLYMVNWSLTLLKIHFACGDLGGGGPS